MKTAVIRLERHDDVISTRDKLKWSQAQRVLLVWPQRGRQVLRSLVDLTILQRYCSDLGMQIALVTRDEQLKANARQLGIPVFRSVMSAQRSRWRKLAPRRTTFDRLTRPVRPEVQSLRASARSGRPVLPYWQQLGAFTLGVLAVLALLVFFLPSAEVTLYPALQEQSLDLPVWANPDLTMPVVSGGLPARQTSIVVEGREQAPATGWTSAPKEAAAGTVTFRNLTDRDVEIQAGTQLLTNSQPSIRFETTRPVRVSAGPGKTANAPAIAVMPGNRGNVAVGAIQTIDGTLGLSVAVENQKPFSGGSDRSAKAPNAKDYSQLKEKLIESLKLTALHELDAGAGDSEWFIPETVRVSSIVMETQDPPVGTPADNLSLTMQIEFSAWSISTQQLEAIANSAFSASQKPGVSIVPGSFRYQLLTDPEIEGDQARWTMRVSRQLQSSLIETEVVKALQGVALARVPAVLNPIVEMSQPPDIHIYPSWWKRMPFLPFRISIKAESWK